MIAPAKMRDFVREHMLPVLRREGGQRTSGKQQGGPPPSHQSGRFHPVSHQDTRGYAPQPALAAGPPDGEDVFVDGQGFTAQPPAQSEDARGQPTGEDQDAAEPHPRRPNPRRPRFAEGEGPLTGAWRWHRHERSSGDGGHRGSEVRINGERGTFQFGRRTFERMSEGGDVFQTRGAVRQDDRRDEQASEHQKPEQMMPARRHPRTEDAAHEQHEDDGERPLPGRL